jgi:endonuclease/exonuclease/phosphatase family metal-dependent hydrolase
MRKTVLAVALSCLFGCGATPDTPDLSVLSFNIRYGTADDGENSWQHRREFVFDVIRDQEADIVGLQEALRFQLDEIADAVTGYSELGVGRDDGVEAGEYAAILYREEKFEALDHGTFWFADTPELPGAVGWGAHIPRICTWARLRDRETARSFYVFNVHLDHQSQESRERSTTSRFWSTSQTCG